LRQDDDVLDTWFSSWLWPISVFDPEKPGFPDKKPNKELAYYYPTNDLITAPEIIFFWVARMVMAGTEFSGKIPFRNVYFTGIVRDKKGRKMSKSLGNSPDPIKMMEEYGADGVRVGMLLCSSAGNDILFDISQVEQGRNFANKIWNAYRLVSGWEYDASLVQSEQNKVAVEWFSNRLSKTIELIDDHFEKFRLSDSLMTVYKLFWDDFCAWYLEIIKPGFNTKIDKKSYDATMGFFDSLLKLLHPYMPFITEELWQNLAPRREGETIMLQLMPQPQKWSQKMEDTFEIASQAVMNIRNIRQSKGISNKESLELYAKEPYDNSMTSVIEKLANVSSVKTLASFDSSIEGANFLVGTTEFFVPLKGLIDEEEERAKINAEIQHLTKFLAGVNAKLSNEKFVNNAPADVVAVEQKKRSDAMQKIESLNNRLKSFEN
jgi:valyl-tRNA synthetase